METSVELNLEKKVYPKKVYAEKRVYTEEEMNELINECITVAPDLWEFLGNGSFIRYVRKNIEEESLDVLQRFRFGAYIKFKCTDKYTNERKFIMENIRNGEGKPKYVVFPLKYNAIETLWKKYDESVTIELNLIHNSLEKKDVQLKELNTRLTAVENLLKAITNN